MSLFAFKPRKKWGESNSGRANSDEPSKKIEEVGVGVGNKVAQWAKYGS